MKAHEVAHALEGHPGQAEVCDENGHPIVAVYASEDGYVAVVIDWKRTVSGEAK